MEDKELMNNMSTNIEELREAEELYKNCLIVTEEELKYLAHPSLKYAVYSFNINEAFQARIEKMITSIEDIKKKLNKNINNELDITKEKEKLDEFINKLNIFKKESEELFCSYDVYLVKVAKSANTIKNDIAKNIYIKTSEEIINMQIKYNIKCEKSLILFKDYINNLKNIFNIENL
jgi:hypothetical protein